MSSAAHAILRSTLRGSIPAMITDQGTLMRRPPSWPLLPKVSPRRRSRRSPTHLHSRRYRLSSNSFLCSTVHVAHAHGRRGSRWADDPTPFWICKWKVPHSVAACFELIEQYMFKGPWVMGANYTICDPICSPWPDGWRATASIPRASPKCWITGSGWWQPIGRSEGHCRRADSLSSSKRYLTSPLQRRWSAFILPYYAVK